VAPWRRRMSASEVVAKVILSPNIFVMVMKFWSISIDIALAFNSLMPMKRIDRTNTSHILFDVDMLVFHKGHKQSTNTINELLEEFRLFTGLTVNKQKKQGFLSQRV